MLSKARDIAKQNNLKFIREMRVRADSIEANDDRTIEFVGSTETAVELYWGETEILLHGDSNVDLSYLDRRKSPVLLDHMRREVIGVIESATLENKELILMCRFSQSAKGNEIYQDIVDGIRNNASIGYTVQEWEVDKADKANPIYTATLWTPREMSIVAFPADINAGRRGEGNISVFNQESIENSLREAGRKDYFIRSEHTIEIEEDNNVLKRAEQTAEPTEETQTGEENGGVNDDGTRETPENQGGEETQTSGDGEGGGDETQRGEGSGMRTRAVEDPASDAKNIIELCRTMDLPIERARKAIAEKRSYTEFYDEIVAEMGAVDNGDGTAQVAGSREFEGVQVEPKDAEQFSIVRAIHGELGLLDAGFEREIMEDEAGRREKADMPTRGLAIPMSVVGNVGSVFQRRASMIFPRHEQIQQRATLIAGTDNVGGNLVAEELRSEEFIDYLWAESAVLPYATIMPNLRGDVAIPKQLSRVQASWVGETDAATESNPTFGLIRLTPKDMRVKVPYSRRLSLQSELSIEPLLRMVIMSSFAQFLDKEILYGVGGANAIDGIANIAAVKDATKQLKTYPQAGLTYAACLDALSTIAKNDALTSGMAWAVSVDFWKQAMITPRLTGADTPIYNTMGNMMMPGKGEIAGFPSCMTTQVKDAILAASDPLSADDPDAAEAFAADWMKVFLGIWGGLDIEVDDKTTLDQGVFNLVAFWTVDTGYAHDESFVRLKRAA